MLRTTKIMPVDGINAGLIDNASLSTFTLVFPLFEDGALLKLCLLWRPKNYGIHKRTVHYKSSGEKRVKGRGIEQLRFKNKNLSNPEIKFEG